MSENKEIKELTTEHLAMEVLKQEQRRSKALIIGLSVGLAVSGIATITTAICGVDERKHLVEKNYQNDCDWRTLFSDYDFISQDGEGINTGRVEQWGRGQRGRRTGVALRAMP